MRSDGSTHWSSALFCAAPLALLDCDSSPTAPNADGDGIPDHTDNCPQLANASQADLDGDGIGDACEIALTVIHDEFFHPTSWRVFSVDSSGGASHVAVQGSGELGNSGFYRRMTHEHALGSSIAVVHELLGQVFDPETQGEIVELDAEFDAALVSPPEPRAAVLHALVVMQEGSVYAHAYAPIARNQWLTFLGEKLTAADFRNELGQSPDWTRAGTTPSFGIRRTTLNAQADSVLIVHTMANLNLFVRSRPGAEAGSRLGSRVP